MKFDAFSGSHRSRRKAASLHAPAIIESLEMRTLLAGTGPSILSPTGNVASSQPIIRWTNINTAVSYDLWISDVETRERIVYQEGIVGRKAVLSGSENLHLGLNRIWVRGVRANGSKTDWGVPSEVLLSTKPRVTGPRNPANPTAPRQIETSDWAIRWKSPVGATSFEVFLSNQTTQTSSVYTVQNQVPLLDANGEVMNDGAGNPILQEVRSLYLDGAVPVVGAVAKPVTNVVNKSYIDITSNYHGLASGDRVRITGVEGNTGANGNYSVIVISENVFRLRGASSTGEYTTGGRWVRLAGNVPFPGAATRFIDGVTNSNSINITVAGHGLTTGDKVLITGVEGNTAANGTYFVNVLNTDLIRLDGITGTQIYTKGGQLRRLTEFRSDLLMGKYRAFVRSIDDAGRVSQWSGSYNFAVMPRVTVISPKGPSFDEQPLLRWEAVPGATHYEVEVYKKGESVPLYAQPYLTTTYYRIPDALSADPVQNFEFRVRARRLHQVSRVELSGDPASGGFHISLTTTGKSPTTFETGLLVYNSTADQVRDAIIAIEGFEGVEVVVEGTAPNLTYLIQIPLTGNYGNPMVIGGNPVRVAVTETVEPGTVTTSTIVSRRVDGLWSPLTSFSTIQSPVITGPLGIDSDDPNLPRTVTDLRPVITWTAIDRAARYEIWVERSASTSTYLRTTSSVNSYQFREDILSGDYTVRVRAISTTGKFTDWSDLYRFAATGGVPILNTVTVSPGSMATFTWAGVAEADSYEIQVAWIGVNFDYLHPTNIRTTSYTTAPLAAGNYRIWVRAVLSDGTQLGWSSYQNFTVVEVEQPSSMPLDRIELAALESSLGTPERVAVETSEIGDTSPDYEGQTVEERIASPDGPFIRMPGAESSAASGPAIDFTGDVPENEELIQQLAEACIQQEWWTADEMASS